MVLDLGFLFGFPWIDGISYTWKYYQLIAPRFEINQNRNMAFNARLNR